MHFRSQSWHVCLRDGQNTAVVLSLARFKLESVVVGSESFVSVALPIVDMGLREGFELVSYLDSC